jgi:Subtilase family
MGGGSAGVSPLSLPPPRAPAVAAPPAPSPTADANEFEPAEVLVFAPFAESAQGALEIIANAGGTVLQQDSLTQLEGLLLRVRANDGDAFRLATVLRQQLPQATVDLHGRLFLFPLAGSGSTGSAPRHYDSGIERIGALERGVGGEKSFMPNDASPADSVHGTTVAAMIAGYDEGSGFSGAAPGAKLYVARAMSLLPDGRSYTNAASVLRALDWLLAERVTLVNMSLGGRGDSTLAVGIAQAIRKGMVVVAAAGNGGAGAQASFPAALPDVVAVTALDVESKLYNQANRGDYVMIAAPGVDIWAPQRTGGGSYVSGTSFAAAWVSGALALAQAQRGDVARSRWSSELCASAKDLGRGGRDSEFGCGLLQTEDLLRRLK